MPPSVRFLKSIHARLSVLTLTQKGRTTQLHDTWAANENLWQIGFAKRLDTFIHLNPSSRGVVQDRLMATTMEAILGAVYLDGQKDIAAVLRVVLYLGLTDDA
jgi:ribonuclease-3